MDRPLLKWQKQLDFNPSWDWFAKKIKFDLFDDDLQNDAKRFFEQATPHIKPSFSAVVCHVENLKQVDDHWEMDVLGNHYSGKVLKHLKGIKTVAPYIQTCGIEIDETKFSDYDDMLLSFWLDTIKVQGLNIARQAAIEFFKDFFSSKNVASVNPGSGPEDLWPIEQLGLLFRKIESFIPVDAKIIRNAYMLPNKTVCGIFYSTEKPYLTCTECQRENCIGRKAPYKKKL